MANGPLGTVIRYLRGVVAPEGPGRVMDAELLERFVSARDQAAFELLLWRHGPMVLGVCRRVLRREQDAEDAFQATFLTFVRKAESIGKREALAGWLYRVAYRIALAEKAGARKHAAAGPLPDDLAGTEPSDDLVWRDLRDVLDEEVNRLPEKYRLPFVLCYLEGKTNEEAAHELGCPLGTIWSRLAWARDRLRDRLSRRDVTLSAGVLAAALADNAAPAAVPAALLDATVAAGMHFASEETAAAGLVSSQVHTLTQGALETMVLTKSQVFTLLLVLGGVLVLGAAWLLEECSAAERSAPQVGAPPDLPPQARDKPMNPLSREQAPPPDRGKGKPEVPSAPDEPLTLGEIRVGEQQGQVLFSLENDRQTYRVDVLITKAWKDPPIKAERIQVWLLAKDSKTVALKERHPNTGALLEVGSRGATAYALFLLQGSVDRQALLAVVVAVDGELRTFKIPPPRERK
jgi:RNA polymerase sigma factor (sigma-70 family)